MRGLGLDLYSALTSVDSTYYGYGPGEPTVPWWQKVVQIGTGIYQDIAGPQNPSYYPGTSQTYPYYPVVSSPVNWLPWLLIGGAVILVAASKKK